MLRLARSATLMLALLLVAAPALAGGEIYGTIHTASGDGYTGPIRWDANENFWDDLLDASKKDPVKGVLEGEGLDLRIFGVQLFRSRGADSDWVNSQFSIPFGHLRSIEPGEDDLVAVELKSGRTIEVRESGDLGDHMRGVVIEDAAEGRVALDWDDLTRVEFHAGPPSLRHNERLYGTVTTSIGEFTGFIAWDRDEALLSDTLDGLDRDRTREIPFRRIARIENAGARGARVQLTEGENVSLHGTNDVNNQNRGIEITIGHMGKVVVPWSQFQAVTFEPPPESSPYQRFDGGHRLYGTLTTTDGQTHTGEIVWDNDESWTWESLDGEIAGVDFMVLFEHISSVERISLQSARVVMKAGLAFELSGSNDVNHKNKGIRVRMAGGEEIEVDWTRMESVVFSES